MGNLFSKMSKIANAADFIYLVELQVAARESLYPNLNEARESTFESMKGKYKFEEYDSYFELIEKNKDVKISKEFQATLLASQIKWFHDRGFGHILN